MQITQQDRSAETLQSPGPYVLESQLMMHLSNHTKSPVHHQDYLCHNSQMRTKEAAF